VIVGREVVTTIAEEEGGGAAVELGEAVIEGPEVLVGSLA